MPARYLTKAEVVVGHEGDVAAARLPGDRTGGLRIGSRLHQSHCRRRCVATPPVDQCPGGQVFRAARCSQQPQLVDRGVQVFQGLIRMSGADQDQAPRHPDRRQHLLARRRLVEQRSGSVGASELGVVVRPRQPGCVRGGRGRRPAADRAGAALVGPNEARWTICRHHWQNVPGSRVLPPTAHPHWVIGAVCPVPPIQSHRRCKSKTDGSGLRRQPRSRSAGPEHRRRWRSPRPGPPPDRHRPAGVRGR